MRHCLDNFPKHCLKACNSVSVGGQSGRHAVFSFAYSQPCCSMSTRGAYCSFAVVLDRLATMARNHRPDRKTSWGPAQAWVGDMNEVEVCNSGAGTTGMSAGSATMGCAVHCFWQLDSRITGNVHAIWWFLVYFDGLACKFGGIIPCHVLITALHRERRRSCQTQPSQLRH